MDPLALLVDLHRPNARLGPGSDAHTRLAIALARLGDRPRLDIADLGCGTGASTLVLAEELDAHITAVDLFAPFLDELRRRADARGVASRITTRALSFDALPFDDASLDVIWSEGAIYQLGFERGVAAWRRFLRPGGVLAVSELTWLTDERPAEIDAHWKTEYPEVDVASAKLAVLERHGFSPIGYFTLPPSCWLEAYYRPLEQRFADFLDAHGHSEGARACVDEHRREIALYERFHDAFSYGFYVAEKTRQ